jgi:hypothetical protein
MHTDYSAKLPGATGIVNEAERPPFATGLLATRVIEGWRMGRVSTRATVTMAAAHMASGRNALGFLRMGGCARVLLDATKVLVLVK